MAARVPARAVRIALSPEQRAYFFATMAAKSEFEANPVWLSTATSHPL